MGKAESMISAAIKETGMTIKAVSRKTGIPYGRLQPSVSGDRELRADEFLALCALLKLDPKDAAEYPASAYGWFFQDDSHQAPATDEEKADAPLEAVERMIICSNTPAAKEADTVARVALAYGDSVAYSKMVLDLAKRVLVLRGKELKQIVRAAAEHPASA